jgi:hypothetical protein
MQHMVARITTLLLAVALMLQMPLSAAAQTAPAPIR